MREALNNEEKMQVVVFAQNFLSFFDYWFVIEHIEDVSHYLLIETAILVFMHDFWAHFYE